MKVRVHVVGTPRVLEVARKALPEFEVVIVEGPTAAAYDTSECLVVSETDERARELFQSPRGAIVRLTEADPEPAPFEQIPVASLQRLQEIRLAVRCALSLARADALVSELSGPWAHDARGALGVARLALKLLEPQASPASPTRKIDNGVTRLGFLMERLPQQTALALGLPLPAAPAQGLFPTLSAYLTHLGSIHPQRTIESTGNEWMDLSTSEGLVPFAAGLIDLAIKVSSARASLRIGLQQAGTLMVECDCPGRREPWNICGTFDATALLRRPVAQPFRLLEALRLALRSNTPLTIELTDELFVARVGRAAQ